MYTLTLIINQMITTGIFPDDLKVAKVITLFKKGKREILDNHRPISLLHSLSKIFERVIFNQILHILQHMTCIIVDSMASERSISLN